MSRYIDADKLIEQFDKDSKKYDVKDFHMDFITEEIQDAPIADVVEVVRCKDCKYATYDKSIDRYDCRNWGSDGDEYTEADDFCSYGERK